MIIDFHTHFFPDSIAFKTIEALSGAAKLIPFTDGTMADLKRSMEQSSVDKSVLLQIATKPSQTSTVNTFASDVNAGNIIAFGSVHPDYDQWEEELERIKELGLKGVKLHPDYQRFYVNDKRMIPIYQKISELGLITVLHAGIDIGLYPPLYSAPLEIKSIIKCFQKAPLVLAHMGSCLLWDGVEEHLVGENVYFDTSFSYGKMSNEQMIRIIEKHGHKKILFGTDSPWGGQKEEIANIKSLGFSQTELEDIFCKNAESILFQ